MATTITQKPLYNPLPVGQQIIFTVSNNLVNNYFNVKFIAEVYMSQVPPNLAVTTDLIGTFKTTPNTVGVGIFDFSSVVENHVKADNLGAILLSQYKTVTTTTSTVIPPIHLIDKYSANTNAMKYLVLKFNMEGSLTQEGIPEIIDNQNANSTQFKIFNGYLKETDKLDIFDNDFGFAIGSFSTTPIQLGGPTASFLTNAPTTQYANIDDYGTFMPPNFDYFRPHNIYLL